MPVPKSVTKIKKNGVEFVSNVDQVNYYLFELSRAALRDVGKFVAKEFKKKYYYHFKKHSGDGGRVTKYKVYSNKNTITPRVEIGVPHAYRGNKVDGFYAYFQELGSSKQPKLGLLEKSVYENIDTIQKIEAQYLSALNDDSNKVESLIDEQEYEGGANE